MATLHQMDATQRIAEKTLSEVIAQRRATQHFESTPIPAEDLKKIVWAGLEAPSGYNLQPWRFVLVRDAPQRQRLREAAMGQDKVAEAPVIVVACGNTQGWRHGDLDDMLRLGNQHGFPESGNDGARQAVNGLLGGQGGTAAGINGDVNIWVNRHVMIAYTSMMLMAEALGYDTAPLEGYCEDKVKQVLGIPEPVRVVALLAIGRRKGPDKPYGGRFDVSQLVFDSSWGKPAKL